MTLTGRLAMYSRPPIAAAVIATVAATVACGTPATLTQLVEAQRRTATLHLTLTRSIEAGNRAVMAADDETAARAAGESRDAVPSIVRQTDDLRRLLESLAYQAELNRLDGFTAAFAEYRRLNDDILSLVLENTNVKAQRLSFGPSADAAAAFHRALDAAIAVAPAADACTAGERASRAWAAILQIRAEYPRHIAEADDAEMTRMETGMTGAAARARAALDQLTRQLPGAGGPLSEARAALDRFMAVHAEILDLSRRNSNVRALALSLGRKRAVAADAEAHLIAVEEALKTHEFNATR